MESGGCDTTTIRRLTHSCVFRNSLVLLVENLMLFWNVGGAALSHASFTAYGLDAVESFAKIKRAWSLPPHCASTMSRLLRCTLHFGCGSFASRSAKSDDRSTSASPEKRK